MSDEAELRAAWAENVGASGDAAGASDDVVGRHREPHRRYHGVRHVTWVVRHVRELAGAVAVADLGAVVAAAFFHDAVYDPRRSDNEARSAALGERVLAGLGWDSVRTRTAAEHIRATADHAATDDPDRGVLLDADLAVLGSDPGAYQAYVNGVRAEYAHVDAAAWRAGRAGILTAYLERPALYSTDPARARWEARARANLVAELAALR